MSALIVFFVLLAAATATLLIGPAAAFAAIYLPSLLLINVIPPVRLQMLPDLSAPYAAVLGISAMLLVVPASQRKIRFNLLDALILLLSTAAIISAVTTEFLFTGVNVFFEQALGFVLPYFLARIAFRSIDGRNWMLHSAVAATIVVAAFAVIEMRLYPHFYRSLFESMGLYPADIPRMAYKRWFLFRAESTFEHPIFLGNGSLVLLGLIAMLGLSVGRSLKSPVVLAGLAAAAAGLAASLSFSPYNGLIVGLATLVAVYLLRPVQWSVPVIALCVILAGVAYTAVIAGAELPPKPVSDGALADSMWIRKLIIHNAWPMLLSAGPFGHGKVFRIADIQLESIDNTYLLNGMARGWVFLGLWLLIPVVLGAQVSRAFRSAWTKQHRLMLAIGYATIVATMVAMYTVWAGWAGQQYTVLWIITAACLSSACQMLAEAAPAAHTDLEDELEYDLPVGEAA